VEREAGELFRDVIRHYGTVNIPVERLKSADLVTLVQELLGLESDLLAQITQRTEGNPLFAVHLVGDLVQRGALGVGEKGFKLTAPVEEDLPGNLVELWSVHLDALLAPRSEEDGMCLECAAILGKNIETGEWERACALQGWRPSDGLVEALVERRWAVKTTVGWHFSHGMLREFLEHRAREKARFAEHHRQCAVMLADRGPYVLDRVGRHWMDAGDLDRAFDALLEASRFRGSRGHHAVAESLLDVLHTVLGRLGAPDHDRRSILANLYRSETLAQWGHFGQAIALGEENCRAAEGSSEPSMVALTSLSLSKFQIQAGELDVALASLAELEHSLEHFEPKHVLDWFRWMGFASLRKGQLEESRRYYHCALETADSDLRRAHVYADLGGVEVAGGRIEEARRWAERAMACYESEGSRDGVAQALNLLGEVARQSNDPHGAEKNYRASIQNFRRIGNVQVAVPQFNLAMVLLELGKVQQSKDVFLEVLAKSEQEHATHLVIAAHLALLACAGSASDWDAWDVHIAKADALINSTGLVDADYVRCAERAAGFAADAGQDLRSDQARALVGQQTQRLHGFGKT
jgi:eukaryotic-like serine/threonine-protein kinase